MPLGLAQGVVGLAEQRHGVHPATAHGHPHAHRRDEAHPAHGQGRGHGPAQGLRNPGDGRRVGNVVQHHDELIATQSPHHVLGPQRCLQPLRDRHQHLIAGLVVQPVVDLLEVVHVDEEDRCVGARRGRSVASGQHRRDHLSTVGQAGQGIVAGAVGELVQRALFRRHIDHLQHDVAGPHPLLDQARGHVRPQPPTGAVHPLPPDAQRLLPPRQEGVPRPVEAAPDGQRHEPVEGHAHEVLPGRRQVLLQRGVRLSHDAVEVQQRSRHRGFHHRLAVGRLRLDQFRHRPVRPGLLGQVQDVHDHPHVLA